MASSILPAMYVKFLRFRQWFWILPLGTFLGVFLWALNFAYPLIGHDHLLFLPKLLAGKWHFARQGFLPFRFTPHFCGGLPMYGNPQDMYYSLPQLLTLVMDPWKGIQGSILVAMLLGYSGWYLFGRDVLRLSSSWAHLFSLIILSNGFYLLHMIVGHLTFHTVPLLGLLLWVLFDQRRDTVSSLLLRASGFALTTAYALYAGYPIVLIFGVLSTVLLLPLDLLCSEKRRSRFRLLLVRFLVCGFVAFLLGMSKFIAVWSFMRFFPRHYPFDAFAVESASTLLFIARSFWYIPQGRFLFTPAGVEWGTHEYSMFLSPITLMGLLCGVLLIVKKGSWVKTHKLLFTFLILYVLFLFLFFTQLTRGYGLIPLFLQKLPLFQSLHVTARFLYLFSLLVSGAGVLFMRACIHSWQLQKWEEGCITFASILTILALPIAYYPLLSSSELGVSVNYEGIRKQLTPPIFLDRPVTYVRDGKLDLQHVIDGTTAIHCFEPLFGYYGEHFTSALSEGPVEMEKDGFFNLHNPACFQYPKENSCEVGDRIVLSDRENFANFLRGLPVHWKYSSIQIWSDWISFTTLILTTFLVFYGFTRKIALLWKR